MRFVKMQALGNDYVYVDLFHQRLPKPPEQLAVEVSRPHFGVGADGLILIEPWEDADAKMRVFNADGSEALMCGNGIRCVGKYLYDSGICRREQLRIQTGAGPRLLTLQVEKGLCVGASVDMGQPVFEGEATAVQAAGQSWLLQKVSMGNPHGVCFLPQLPQDALFHAAGAALERAPIFPHRANIEFCQVQGQDRLAVRVWERGSGETLACGTGACAAAAAAIRAGFTGPRVTVALPGGELDIRWQEDGHVLMTGPAQVSFTGEWPD